ncbi:MAG TPA: YceK/YidQ family lipoprotein [Planctomycetota bacterium]
MKPLAAALLLGLAGCGTIVDIAGGGPLEGPNPHVFGGVRYDWDFASTGGPCCRTAALAPCFLFDIPISLAADVVMLPITVPVSLFRPKPIKME